MASSSASASAASSSLTRPRIAIAVVSAFVAASLGYSCYRYLWPDLFFDDPRLDADSRLTSGLVRRNALRRPRRASQRRDDSSASDSHGDENAAAGTLVPIHENAPYIEEQPPDDWYNDPSQGPRMRTGENIVTLLFRVSEDNARRNAYVHRGCQCNSCGMVPIRGFRYRCANCADFDLCEVCEAQNLHNKSHIFYKVKVPAPPFAPRYVQSVWYPGDPDTALRNLPRPLLDKWSQETPFDRMELDALWEQWTFMANTEWRDDPNSLGLAMDRKTFERCLVPSGGYRYAAPNLIHDRMFAFYDTNRDDLIGFEEFIRGVSYKKQRTKLLKIFQGYDVDGDGYVSRRDFLRLFRAYYVIYKQWHRDLLDGLDDSMGSNTEAQQLVNSRQPLSSVFGREGRVPAADHGRPMDGKIFRSGQDAEVHDGRGAVSEDRPDTSSREDILREMFVPTSNPSHFTESFGSSSRSDYRGAPDRDMAYWSGILNPPRNSVELTSLVSGNQTQLNDLIDSLRRQEPGDFLADDPESGTSDGEDESSPDEQLDDEGEPIRPAVAGDPDTRVSPDARGFVNTLPVEVQFQTRPETASVPSQRLNMDKKKRLIARKQLFERWKRRQFYVDEEEGGLPPQGWREDQDILSTAQNTSEPTKRPQALSPRSRSSSKVRFAEDTDELETILSMSTSGRSVPERWGGIGIPDAERDAGKEILYQVTQQALNELLDELFKKKEDLAIRAAETKEQREQNRHVLDSLELNDEEEESETESIAPSKARGSPEKATPAAQKSLEDLLATSGYTISSQANNDLPEAHPTDLQEPVEHRDPTMPQFRPNTSDDLMKQEPFPEVDSNIGGLDTFDHVPHSTLITWKRLDLAEKEAAARGGWGRLSYEEFEQIYKEHELADSRKNRLDYLGSWIDFCIP
ncbi:hypothetical protein F5Y18DRAFT_310494 [Xylariaceae sp. FL1019]|nr:hypothetical protein F5Y18DRAFT_310494 [Xylariaceae sp. FL1019]